MSDLIAQYARCETLARSHYENFPVGWLVPPALRPHVHAIYAFARTADDFADEGFGTEDEVATRPQRLDRLTQFGQLLHETLHHPPGPQNEYDWIFQPLADTLRRFQIPEQLCHDLLSAFSQDVVKTRYATFDEVLDYCRRSANPIGRLLLHLHRQDHVSQLKASDAICTGLQLANFWQDISVDRAKDRIYLPLEDLDSFGVSVEDILRGRSTPQFRRCLAFQVQRTHEFFEQGRCLPASLTGRLSWEIRLTWMGGVRILEKIRSLHYDTLHTRPKLGKADLLWMAPIAWWTRKQT